MPPTPRLLIACTLLVSTALAGAVALSRDGTAEAGIDPSFTRQVLTSIDTPTSMAFGPDGRLYVVSLGGIDAITFAPGTYDVTGVEHIADLTVGLGIAFDPTASDAPVSFYVSHQDTNATPGYQGVISRYTGASWSRADVITGLPSSSPHLNHFTNGLAFDASGRLFIAQGSMTDAGLDDPPVGGEFWNEVPLSAAILVAEVNDPGFDGALIHDPPTSPASDEVELVGGDVSVFASGLRNPYDLVLHSNGLMYATDNGPFGAFVSATCESTGTGADNADELNLIEEGNYYGHPNRNRGRNDARQCTYHRPRDPSGGGYTAPIAVLPEHCSCDGIDEYTAGTFGGAMQGNLVYAEFTRGTVTRAVLSGDGRSVVELDAVRGGLAEPLDVVARPDGAIVVAEHGGGVISVLLPAGPAPTATPSPTPGPSSTPTATSTPGTPPSPTSTASPVPTATRTPTPEGPRGDVSCDGAVNSIDAALILQRVAGLLTALPCGDLGDVDLDGDIDAVDAALVLQLEAGLIDGLPA